MSSPATRADGRAALSRWNPAPFFLELYDKSTSRRRITWDDPVAELASFSVGVPDELFIAPGSQQHHTRGVLIPLLDNGNFDEVLFDDSAGGLVSMLVEDETVRIQFVNWDQYLAYLMIQISEAVDDDATLLRIGQLIGFAHTTTLLQFLDNTAGSSQTFEGAKTNQRRFLDGLALMPPRLPNA
ncbi:hypothetical protein [Alienimonas chondri]|uniref:Uncharacterized protein n=1 Tax=Alienimonas chondri TaxID=2681879 RepID=A0ABX1VFW9_9PLAN|nr:hypothetical protein [Alienimonas chondri]NNJ26435.1 hypothetical protein [Alienimonas chondri]